MQIDAAIGAFFVEFSKFEMNGVGTALRALTKEDAFVTQAESLLGLEARLTLLERLAFARAIPENLMGGLAELMARARTLRERRDDLSSAVWLPSLSQIDAHTTEAIELQRGFRALAESWPS